MNSLKIPKNYANTKKQHQLPKAKKPAKRTGVKSPYLKDEKAKNKVSDKLLNIYSNLIAQETMWGRK